VEIFRFRRGESIGACTWEAKFLRNPEASMWDYSKVDLKKLQKELDISFIPPAMARRSEETGISPEQYMMQAFWKGKMYYEIFKASEQLNDKLLLELDFVLKINTAAGRLLVSMEQEQGEIDFGDAWASWQPLFKDILKKELEKRRLEGAPPELEALTAPAAPAKSVAPGSGAATAKPSAAEEDVEEAEEEDGEPPPKPTAKPASPSLSLKDRLKSKKEQAKKK